MKRVTIKVYDFLELSTAVQEKVLQDFRYINVKYNTDWSDNVMEDFVMLCSYVGVELCRDDIYYRGFSAQGNGSAFDASVSVVDLFEGLEAQLWKKYAPDVELNFPVVPVSKRILALIKAGKIDLSVRFCTCNRETSMRSVMNYSFNRGDLMNYDRLDEEMNSLEGWLDQVAEVLRQYLYQALEAEYDYFCTDEAVINGINADGYLFLADGMSAKSFLQHATVKKVA